MDDKEFIRETKELLKLAKKIAKRKKQTEEERKEALMIEERLMNAIRTLNIHEIK